MDRPRAKNLGSRVQTVDDDEELEHGGDRRQRQDGAPKDHRRFPQPFQAVGPGSGVALIRSKKRKT